MSQFFTAEIIDYTVIILYMIAVLGIGFLFSREEKTSVAYLLGGRNMPYLAIAISCTMSLLSSVSLVMAPGEVFNHGLSLRIIPALIAPFFGIPFYLLFMRFYFRLGSFTPYEYLEHRYTPAVRGLIAITSFYGQLFYLSTVLFTSAKIFEGTLGWAPWVTILVVGVVGTVYTVLGGMKAVVWSDVVQFFVLLISFLVIVVLLCCNVEGGLFGAVSFSLSHGRGADLFAQPDFYKLTPYIRLSFWLILWGAIAGQLNYASSDQIMVQRLLSTKDWRAGFKSKIASVLINWPFSVMLLLLGLLTFAYFSQHPDPQIGPRSGDLALFRFVKLKVPAPLSGLFVAGMLAAIMSTLDSGINSMATVWLKEIHAKFINRAMTPEKEVDVSRIATLTLGVFITVFAILIAFAAGKLKMAAIEVGAVFGILGCAQLPAFLFAVFSKRANAALIWCMTAVGVGEAVAYKFWFVLSRVDFQNFEAGGAAGWAGSLSWKWPFGAAALAVLALVPWFCGKNARKSRSVIAFALVGMFFIGIASVLFLWSFYSQGIPDGSAAAKSFAFEIPMTLILGTIALFFCPVQPKEKYDGLTLSTLKDSPEEIQK